MEKFKNFFRKIFSKNNPLKIESEYKTTTSDNERKNLKENLRIEEKRLNLIELQRKFEKNELDIYSLSKKQLKELTSLYEQQIKELNYKLGIIRNSES